jgi:hypothetical protein
MWKQQENVIQLLEKGESVSGKLRCKVVSLKTEQVDRICSRVKTEILTGVLINVYISKYYSVCKSDL